MQEVSKEAAAVQSAGGDGIPSANKNDGFTAGTVVARYEQSAKSIKAEVQDYWLNVAFKSNHQWVYWNRQTNRLDSYAGDPERVQATVNRIWPGSRTIISKLTQRELAFDVLPTAPDDATMRGASTSEAILHDVHIRHSWENLRVKNSWSTWLGGTAAIAVDWDPKAGNRIDQETFTGDTIETPLSIAEFVVEAGSREPTRSRYWIKAQALPPAQVQATYKLAETPPADATAGLTPLQASLMVGQENGNQRPELTRVLTYYERPNGSCAEGRVAVVINNKFVDGVKKWPFPFKDRLNFAVTYETERDNVWAGETVVTVSRPIQVLYNLAQSNIAEHMKNAGNARLAVPQSSMDMMESFSDLPGEMVPFPDGEQLPSWISPAQMPQWWSDWPSKLEEVMDDLLGVHDVSRGNAPTNIESGYGLSILAEHDSTPVGRMVKSQATAWGEVATMVLELYASMVKETRTALIRSPGDVPEAVPWTGEQLQGQTQAIVPEDAILPRSRAAMQAMAEKMVQMGLVTDLETFTALVELPGQKDIIERARPDVAKARRENSLMALGNVMIPADFDDHTIHIAEHNVFRKSERYDRMNPQLRNVIDTHIAAHETEAAELAGKARQASAIDPLAATAPRGDSRPVLTADQLPPEALSLMAPGADDPFQDPEQAGAEDELAMLAEQAASI